MSLRSARGKDFVFEECRLKAESAGGSQILLSRSMSCSLPVSLSELSLHCLVL